MYFASLHVDTHVFFFVGCEKQEARGWHLVGEATQPASPTQLAKKDTAGKTQQAY